MSIKAMKRALDVLAALDTLFSPVARDSTQRVWIHEAKESIEALRTAIQQAEAQQPATAEPVAWFEYSEQHKSWFLAYTRNPHVLTRPLVFGDTHPAPGVPDDVVRVKLTPLTDAQMEKGREQIFSVNNPYCPCDRKTFKKVAQWVEAHHAAMLAASPAQKGGEG